MSWNGKLIAKRVAAGGVSIALALVIIEHACDIHNIENRPSKFLGIGAKFVTNAWEEVGRLCARISTWPKHLHLDRLISNAYNVFEPSVKMVASPFWTFVGYRKQLFEFYNAYPGTVLLGSAILLGGTTALICWRTGLHHIVRQKCDEMISWADINNLNVGGTK